MRQYRAPLQGFAKGAVCLVDHAASARWPACQWTAIILIGFGPTLKRDKWFPLCSLDALLIAGWILETDIEAEIWSLAAVVYGIRLKDILGLALEQYQRRPRLEDLPRLHRSTICRSAYQALELEVQARKGYSRCSSPDYIG